MSYEKRISRCNDRNIERLTGWLIILWLALVFLLYTTASRAAYYGPYPLIAVVAVDGDTLSADVPVWPGVTVEARIRVIGADSPEINIACERERGLAAKTFTDAWLQRNHPVVIGNVHMDKYGGRYDAIVTGASGERLSDALIKSGHGRIYNGGKRLSWCP